MNTEKGKAFFEKLKSELVIEKVDYDDVLKGNLALVSPVAKPDKSEKFWKLYHKQGLFKAYKVCLKDTFIRKCYRFARRVCRKIKTTIKRK